MRIRWAAARGVMLATAGIVMGVGASAQAGPPHAPTVPHTCTAVYGVSGGRCTVRLTTGRLMIDTTAKSWTVTVSHRTRRRVVRTQYGPGDSTSTCFLSNPTRPDGTMMCSELPAVAGDVVSVRVGSTGQVTAGDDACSLSPMCSPDELPGQTFGIWL
jgi:hypothetical protein